ncbi:S41 family peptidase [Massilia sp. G4R7]|uniref:S41 family peptidase n=1 Tax=Massilia phyllostachyos TaxID=2898585 RepID=A0ABS8Q952_9BURK|nr:S41 family peptidase [Massilia phyllostachyos]MCD2518073.1 S41 family peptidase [Massilia phyllostachyos]
MRTESWLLALLLAGPLAVYASNSDADARCRADLDDIAAFLPLNDAGARDHLVSHGDRIERALRQAREDAARAADPGACDAVLHAYLEAWRPGHLSVSHLGAVTAAAQVRAGTAGDPRLPTLAMLGKDSVLLTIPSFKDPYAAAVRTLLTDHRAQLETHRNWIIDVRDNGGGADLTYAPLLPWLLDGSYSVHRTEFLVTPANLKAQEDICRLTSEQKACMEMIGPIVAKMRAAPNASFVLSGDARVGVETIGKREAKAPAKVAVLVDRDCGGTCEQFLLTVRTGFRVKLVGRPSAGVIDVANMRPHPLSSGRVLKYGTSRSTRASDLRIDTIGIQPDILLPRPADEAGKRAETAQVQRWLETGSWQ